MTTVKPKHSGKLFHIICFLFIISALYIACGSGGSKKKTLEREVFLGDTSIPTIIISPVVPSDIFTDGTAASQANLTQASAFAWQEFIALNWAADSSFRDSANAALAFGADGGTIPLVWHTFRHKVEIFPGNDTTPHGFNSSLPDYGYNDPPQYLYNKGVTGTPDGSVNSCGTPSVKTPWINLDENNEIGVTTMFTGITDTLAYPSPQILFLAKANKAEYVYAAQTGWYDSTNSLKAAEKNTVAYIAENGSTPTPGSSATMVSLPYGTIEIKTAWRRLTTPEKNSGRFYSTTVRYYKQNSPTSPPCYVDEVFGMIALHIIHKTPTAPYFIYATFEQSDNILDSAGNNVEDSNGNIIGNLNATPLSPNLTVTPATPTTQQKFSPTTASTTPGNSLWYQNLIGDGLPTGTIRINKRLHAIPPEVIAVNAAAHGAIAAYNQQNNITNSPWLYYKLINVQYKPIQKTPGVNYTGSDSSSYYQANSVVESDYILQQFSGKFSSNFTITDFTGPSVTDTAHNAYYNGTKYLMGGCMGCHGNATNKGTDYSFIFGKPVKGPEVAGPVNPNSAKLKALKKFLGIKKLVHSFY